MRILLVKPRSSMHVILPPIGLGYLSAYCKRENPDIEIKILDCHRERCSLNNFVRYLEQYKPDVIGFTALSMEIESTLAYAKEAKKSLKTTTIVIGGPHASACPDDLLSCKEIDYVFKGESEIGFSNFIKHFNSAEMMNSEGLVYRKGDGIAANAERYVEDLDKLPFPDYKEMQFEKYPKMYFMKNFPAAPIMSSRGCPFQCAFCAGHKVSGYKWRSRSVGNILSEIAYLDREYRIKEIDFWDDNFTLNKDRAMEFCARIKNTGKKYEWWCPNGVHLNTLDRELIKAMKESGCYAISFGIESGSEKIQKDMQKNLAFDKLREMVKYAYDIGLRTQGFFIIGYPTETEEDIFKTITLSRALPLHRASICLFQPIPGSKIYDDIINGNDEEIKNNLNLACDYSQVSMPTYFIRKTSRIKALQKKAILGFYLRPRIALRLIKENLSLSQMKELLNILKQYIFKR